MKRYDPKKIERKWKKYWDKHQVYKIQEISDKPKYYVLDMFPYPSGAGLHVGHPKGYIATDVVARMKMMQGYNVLHPMGWDAFGLPAENYAIKNKVHPKEAVDKNIATFKKQLSMLGFTYDWDREINTTDPHYYKWTQWIFLQMFKRGLAYESFEPVNWCPVDKTVLANEDLENGRCERCGSVVERRPMRQWVLCITRYADRLLNDLELLKEWPEHIKEMQRNWIGRSEGTLVKFVIARSGATKQSPGSEITLEVFTTRPDTLFGATYMVVAPENSLIENCKLKIENWNEVAAYIEQAKTKTDLERTDLQKDKTGVEIKGLKAVNPVNGEELPIFVADYVLGGYGTGAIMAVPAHDERDFEFAKKHGLSVKGVVVPNDGIDSLLHGFIDKDKAYELDGINIDSEFLDGLSTPSAKEKMIQWLEEKGVGRREVQYKIRDWVFSRQRYWGEPMPLVFCENCAAKIKNQKSKIKNNEYNEGELENPGWIAVPEDQLPVELPKVKHYEPTGTGESPLANIPEFVNTTCPKCSGLARRETNTMPQWAGSCWYYLAYVMRAISNYREAFDYWQPVDLYVGGAEHATRHLIYARFWHKFLYDIGAVKNVEPFTRLQSVGLILAEDGRKMSKRWDNVINPDDIVKEFGADSMRVYEMFMGPFSQPCAWSTNGLVGMRRFLEKVWTLQEKVDGFVILSGAKDPLNRTERDSSVVTLPQNDKMTALLHQTIKKVTDDIEGMRFNTAIAKMMELVNEMARQDSLFTFHFSLLVKLLSPFAPHMTQELWEMLGNKTLLINESWPTYDSELAKEKEVTLAVQVNGKLRDTIVVPADINEEDAKRLALESEKVRKWLEGKEPKKVIYVKGKLVSIVI